MHRVTKFGIKQRARSLAFDKRFLSSKASKSEPNTSGPYYWGFGLGLISAVGTIAWSREWHRDAIKALSDPVLMPFLRLFDPETAHEVAIWSAKRALSPKVQFKTWIRIQL
jgi:hypothetical protein